AAPRPVAPTRVEQQAFDTSPGDAPLIAAERSASPAPRCSECGAGLDTALASCVLSARDDENGSPRRFLVAYCAACGSTFGTTPANSTQ
ncbi:MAG: hypothetical protein M3Z46_06025, partial [Actinomycetota bacterium]|nr:hypothetical protein [Actinomycetota bacterium]